MFQDVPCLPFKAILAALCLVFILVHTHTKGAMARQIAFDNSQFDDGGYDNGENTYCLLCDLTNDQQMCDKCYYLAMTSLSSSSASSSMPIQTKRSSGGSYGSMNTFMCGCCLWTRSSDRRCCDACAAMKRNYK